MANDPRADDPTAVGDGDDPTAIAGRQAPAQRVTPEVEAAADHPDGPGDPPPSSAPTAEAVAAYLAAHPTFLADHPDLLETLILPDQRSQDGVVDLRGHLLQRQRDDIDRLKRQQRAIVSATRAQPQHPAANPLGDPVPAGRRKLRAADPGAIARTSRSLLDLDAAVLSVEGDAEGDPPPLRSA